jgi:hypothetical protein
MSCTVLCFTYLDGPQHHGKVFEVCVPSRALEPWNAAVCPQATATFWTMNVDTEAAACGECLSPGVAPLQDGKRP